MTASIVIRPRANQDVDNLTDYLARSSRPAARRFIAALRRTYEDLANMPGIGSPFEGAREEFTGLHLSAVEGFPNHLIFYRPLEGEETALEVIRVLHAARDLDNIFGASPGDESH